MIKSDLLKILICSAVVCNGNLGYAAEGIQEFSLDEMVVTATRTMRQLQEVPSSVSVVTSKDIAVRNVTSVQEALQYLPGIYMYPTAQGGIQMRGFGDNNILFLVDGQQMNTTYDGSVNLNSIPIENIERIEILRGAASSIYGGHAVGGVISITTKEADKKLSGTSVSSYGSNDTEKHTLVINGKHDKFSWGINYENKESDGYNGYFVTKTARNGEGNIKADLPQLADGTYVLGGRGARSWEHKNYGANIKYDFDASKSIKYIYSKSESEWGYDNPFSYIRDAEGKPVYSGNIVVADGKVIKLKASSFYGYHNVLERDTHALVYKDEDNKFKAIFDFVNTSTDGYSSADVPSDYNKLDWDGLGHSSEHPGKLYNYEIEKAWENLGQHTIVLGGNLKQEEMLQKRFDLSRWMDEDSKIRQYAQDKGKVKNVAIYVQDEYKISGPLTMYVGARWDHYKKGEGSFWSTEEGSSFNEGSASESYNEISPKVALDYKADENTNYYISYGHSFNPPEMYKIYRFSEFSKYWYVPNPELDPETSDTFEIGMKKKLSEATALGVTLYHVDTDDKIAASPVLPGESYKGKGVKKYMNYDSENRNGVEVELKHRFSDKVSGYINYAWQEGKLKKNGVESNKFEIPKHLLHAGLEYNLDRWNALLDCQYVSERQDPAENLSGIGAEEAFFIMNATVNYQLKKSTQLQISINNLLNQEFYADEATAGRTYNIGVRYTF